MRNDETIYEAIMMSYEIEPSIKDHVHRHTKIDTVRFWSKYLHESPKSSTFNKIPLDIKNNTEFHEKIKDLPLSKEKILEKIDQGKYSGRYGLEE